MKKQRIASKNKYCFPSEFSAARLMNGFSVEAAARITGRHVRTIRDWEAGKTFCPQWALRLIVLESRYMEALYGLKRDRSRTGRAAQLGWSMMAANDSMYASGTSIRSLARYSARGKKLLTAESRSTAQKRRWMNMRRSAAR
ncbi:helix-turn-helix domain-containing protein [Collimonas sp. NPDC087041]|uniref:helix-turn-helix domain-containing protein n=1 Tax=Collimonas sp. NPDC087041 TaxID=3363960 RepID=UPI0038297ED9